MTKLTALAQSLLNKLHLDSNQTITTLEFKKLLRGTFPDENWTQEWVSQFMSSQDLYWTYSSDKEFRIYYLQGTKEDMYYAYAKIYRSENLHKAIKDFKYTYGKKNFKQISSVYPHFNKLTEKSFDIIKYLDDNY